MSAMTLNPFPEFPPRHISPAFNSYLQNYPASGVNDYNPFLSYPGEARPNVGPFSILAAFPEQMPTLPEHTDATLPRGDEGEQHLMVTERGECRDDFARTGGASSVTAPMVHR